MEREDEQRTFGPGLWVSVVIATYNRQELLRRLLEQLDDQTIGTSHYEVIAVDDGSEEDTRAKLAGLKTKYALRIERQDNARVVGVICSHELLPITDRRPARCPLQP